MALAVRAKDTQLLVEINRALAQLAEIGGAEKDLCRIRRAVSSPLHGVERAQGRLPIPGSAFAIEGELVVSMDPANLPYSAAKGERPGP